MRYFLLITLTILFLLQCRQKEENFATLFPGKPETPSSIKEEHVYLLNQIHALTFLKDSTGVIAIKLNELMKHHFREEEDYVLPPLGLLPLLASGQIPEQREEIIGLIDKLKSQLTHMSIEHQLIKAYVDELKQAAPQENHPGIFEFEKQLRKHAKTEEEILFPTAILIGEYLKLQPK